VACGVRKVGSACKSAVFAHAIEFTHPTGIQSIPTVVVFRGGEPVTGFVGAHSAATIGGFLDDTIEKHGEAVDGA